MTLFYFMKVIFTFLSERLFIFQIKNIIYLISSVYIYLPRDEMKAKIRVPFFLLDVGTEL